jgi:hypothetical protein
VLLSVFDVAQHRDFIHRPWPSERMRSGRGGASRAWVSSFRNQAEYSHHERLRSSAGEQPHALPRDPP